MGVVGVKGGYLPFDVPQTGLSGSSRFHSIAILVFSTLISFWRKLIAKRMLNYSAERIRLSMGLRGTSPAIGVEVCDWRE